MSELPAVRVTIRNYSVWRSGVLALAASVVGALCAWAVQSHHAQNEATLWLALLLVPGAVGLAASLWRVFPVTLAFDGSSWLLGSADRENDAPIAGELLLSLDLGAWVLLRFVPSSRGGGARPQWLPVQFSATENQWHALRCAIYSSGRQARGDSAKGANAE